MKNLLFVVLLVVVLQAVFAHYDCKCRHWCRHYEVAKGPCKYGGWNCCRRSYYGYDNGYDGYYDDGYGSGDYFGGYYGPGYYGGGDGYYGDGIGYYGSGYGYYGGGYGRHHYSKKY